MSTILRSNPQKLCNDNAVHLLVQQVILDVETEGSVYFEAKLVRGSIPLAAIWAHVASTSRMHSHAQMA